MNPDFSHSVYHLREAAEHLSRGIRAEVRPVEGRVRRALGREVEPEPSRRERLLGRVRAAEHEAGERVRSVRRRVRRFARQDNP